MKNLRRRLTTLLLGSLLLLTACNTTNEESSVLKVGATPVPHAELLQLVKSDLESQGITLEIIEFTDYVTPNLALSEGEIHANFFQHIPYMESFSQEHGLNLVSAGKVHVEPLGLYANKITSLEDLKPGATIAIPNDPTNEGRALILLEANNLIKLSEDAGLEATPSDIVENPLSLDFKAIEAAQLPRSLEDVDAAVINTNYALEAGLNPTEQALIIEGMNSPYANIIAVVAGQESSESIQALVEALNSDKIKDYIESTYNGSIVPAF